MTDPTPPSDPSPGGTDLVPIGDLAAAAGLSVRTLHHYEDVGLLVPDERTAAGHRRYGPAAAARLYRIRRLRDLGMSLEEIGRVLDDPDWDLEHTLRRHRDSLEARQRALGGVRAQLDALLAALGADGTAPLDQLVTLLEDLHMLDTDVTDRISILVYADLPGAYDELTTAFGLVPGEITTAPDGTVVHAELHAGDGTIWLHPEAPTFGLASPRTTGAATASMAVMVDDVDAHHERARAAGAEIVYPPVDQPYGYREYSARDREGGFWSFMKRLDDAG